MIGEWRVGDVEWRVGDVGISLPRRAARERDISE